ncbi:glycoside hydrolase family 16 protein [Lentithecium fluviatile CBS 122367]|uniref:Crh-like protein n=1 Tax=Lentithecium fluviatile CBS 122367 TaxID=1168545 RepID=A0A6G1JBP2_9PLEO|nr:glycoside hydrolase family 16 protein [Lentithecium fluviatile CBS 122367]
MRSTIRAVAALAAAAILALPAAAQTYTDCNPLTQDCEPVSALGKTVNIDFSSASDSFVSTGAPTYGSDGASFTVAKSGDNPNIASRWYIMFGQVDVELKAAPGVGMVSSFFLQSDCLDEIDWEWLGADNAQVQSNYFGKGQTTTYNRGAFHPNPGNQDSFQKYTIIWTAEQIVWQINGVTVRTLAPADSNNQYPQTPMQIKIGAWAGGDSSNSPGTIEWAGGPIDYSKGPFSMQVKSLKVQDYSTGTQYSYGDKSGTWQSIKSNGGQINSGGSPVEESAPAVTSSVNGQPIPFTPSDKSSVYPFVPDATTMSTATTTFGNYPGLPSGWSVSDSGKVVPPSSAPATSPAASSTPSSQASPSEPSSAADASSTVDASPTATTLEVSTTLQNNVATTSTIPPVPTATSSALRPFVHVGLVLLAASFGVLSVIL